ncbi:hypothetical protein G9A89_005365 [Geosiphon pyriformis]|nr:hypothetical protein G9A89_005365 [Geosiphon pyriformis]
MGVTWVMRWQDALGPASIAVLNDKLAIEFGTRVAKEQYFLQCKMYRDNNMQLLANTGEAAPPKFMYTIGTRHGPHLFYTLVDDIIVESERETEMILTKLKNLWGLRQVALIESSKEIFLKGYTYPVGDFIVRLGNLNVSAAYKGMMIEIEYLPSSHPYTAAPILQEFKDMLVPDDASIAQWIPGAVNVDDTFAKVGLSEELYTTAHTMYQHMQLFKMDNYPVSVMWPARAPFKVTAGIPLKQQWQGQTFLYIIKRVNKNHSFIGITQNLEVAFVTENQFFCFFLIPGPELTLQNQSRFKGEITTPGAPKMLGGKMEPIMALTGWANLPEAHSFKHLTFLNFYFNRYESIFKIIRPQLSKIIPNFDHSFLYWGKTPKHNHGPGGGYGDVANGQLPVPSPEIRKFVFTSGVIRRILAVKETFLRDEFDEDKKFYQNNEEYQEWLQRVFRRKAKKQRNQEREMERKMDLYGGGILPKPYIAKTLLEQGDKDQDDELLEDYIPGKFENRKNVTKISLKSRFPREILQPQSWRTSRNWCVYWTPKIMEYPELFELMTKDWRSVCFTGGNSLSIKHRILNIDSISAVKPQKKKFSSPSNYELSKFAVSNQSKFKANRVKYDIPPGYWSDDDGEEDDD